MSDTLTLIDPAVEAERLALAAANRSPNTIATYRQAWKRYCLWCQKRDIEPLPTGPETLSAFIADIILHGGRPATAAVHASAIAHVHREAGLAYPVDTQVRLVLKGAKRLAPPARGKSSLTVEQLGHMVATLPRNSRGLRDRSILLLGFATALRRSNLAALQLSDVEFRAEGLAVRVEREKNLAGGCSRWIGVFPARGRLCPVRALERWLAARGREPGPLYCHVLPVIDPASGLEGANFARIVQRAARLAGLEASQYGAHSLRAGFVTAAAQAGVSPMVIMQTTGHRCLAVVQQYFRPISVFSSNPLAGVF